MDGVSYKNVNLHLIASVIIINSILGPSKTVCALQARVTTSNDKLNKFLFLFHCLTKIKLLDDKFWK